MRKQNFFLKSLKSFFNGRDSHSESFSCLHRLEFRCTVVSGIGQNIPSAKIAVSALVIPIGLDIKELHG